MGDLRFGQRVFAILFQTGSKPAEICGFFVAATRQMAVA